MAYIFRCQKYTFHLRTDVFAFHQHELLSDNNDWLQHMILSILSRLTDPEVFSRRMGDEQCSFLERLTIPLRITLKTAFPPFLGLLSMPYCSVVPEEVVSQTSFRDEPVGTGPFHFQYWKDNVKLVMRKNPHYFEQGLPKLDAVSISFIKDKQAAFLAFLKGDLDFISGLDAFFKDEVLTKSGALQETTKVKLITIASIFKYRVFGFFNG